MVTTQRQRRRHPPEHKKRTRKREHDERADTHWLAWVDGYWRSDGVWVSGHYRPLSTGVPSPAWDC